MKVKDINAKRTFEWTEQQWNYYQRNLAAGVKYSTQYERVEEETPQAKETATEAESTIDQSVKVKKTASPKAEAKEKKPRTRVKRKTRKKKEE